MSVPTTPQPARVLPRAVIVLLGLASAVILVAGLRAASSWLAPVLMALVISIAVHPLRARLARVIPSWAATLVCVVAVYALLLGLVVSIIVATARFATLAVSYHDQFADRVNDLTTWIHHLGVSSDQLAALNGGVDLSRITSLVTEVVGDVASIVSGLVLVLALLLFMGIDGSALPDRLAETALVRPRMVSALVEFAATTRQYLFVSTVFGLIVAVLDTIALELLGVPAPLLWGLLAFLTNYIPNIGFVIGLVPPAVLALLDSGAGKMIAVIVIYSLLNLVIQSGIQPKVVGDTVGLSTTLTFLSLVFWAWVLGPLGAILAVPMSLLVRAVLVDADPDNAWLRPLVANREESVAEPPSGLTA